MATPNEKELFNNIDYIFEQTKKVHPQNNIPSIIADVLISGEPLSKYITRQGNPSARAIARNISTNDLIKALASQLLIIINAGNVLLKADNELINVQNQLQKKEILERKCPHYFEACEIFKIIGNSPNNLTAMLFRNKDLLCQTINIFTDIRYNYDPTLRNILEELASKEKDHSIQNKINADAQKMTGVSQVHINENTVNKCFIDLVNGNQFKRSAASYNLHGTLFASQRIGRKDKQEDSVIILEHPNNPNFKFLAVADGMGGHSAGEKASNFVLRQMSNWFYSLNPEMFKHPQELSQMINKKLIQVNHDLYNQFRQNYQVGGTTFVGALVTNKNTIISSIGDSRAYIIPGLINGFKPKLLTYDESVVWFSNFKQNDKISSKDLDDLPFKKGKNCILRALGFQDELSNIQTKIIDNNYEKLLLFSDGVTDLLNNKKIQYITRHTPLEKVADALVDWAITHNAIRLKGADEEHNAQINAAKDNASAVMYARR